MNYFNSITRSLLQIRFGCLDCWLLIVLISGCTLPKVAPSHVKALDSFLRAPHPGQISDLAKDQEEWPGKQWWSQWHDNQLNQLIKQALDQAPALDEARARIEAAAALTEQQKTSLKPSTQAQAKPSYDRFTADEFIPPPYGANTYWDNQVLVQSRLELDLWGKNHAALRAALDQKQVSEAEAAQVQQSLIADLVDVYLQFTLADVELEQTKAILNMRKHLLDLAKKRRQAGLGTDLEVSRAIADLAPTQQTLAHQQTALHILRNQLAMLCGQPPASSLHLTTPTLSLNHSLHPPYPIPLHWLGRRPDIIADRWRIEADSETIKVAKTRFYPDINLEAFAGYQALGFTQLFSSSAMMYGLSPALSLPLFKDKELQAALDVSAARRDADVARYNRQLLQAIQEVSDLLAMLHGLDEEQQTARMTRNQACDDEALNRKGYQAGLLNETEYDHMILIRRQREQELDRLEASQLRTEVHLIRALGGGWLGASTQLSAPHHE